MYQLAEALGKTVGEIRQMDEEEFNGWIAFSELRKEERAKR